MDFVRMNVEQLQWLVQRVGEDSQEGRNIKKHYAEQLSRGPEQPVYPRWEDRVRLPARLEELRCPTRVSSTVRLPLPAGQANISRTPRPTSAKAGRKQGDWPSHEPSSNPLPKHLEPRVPGGVGFELARLRTLQRRPEGRGADAAQCAFVSRAYEHTEEERQKDDLEAHSQFPDVLGLCSRAELRALREWSTSDPEIGRSQLRLTAQDLTFETDGELISLPGEVVSAFMSMLDTFSVGASAPPGQPQKPITRVLPPTFASDPIGAASMNGITEATIDVHQAIVIPVQSSGLWALVVMEPRNRRLLSIRPNNGPGIEEIKAVRLWMKKWMVSEAGWNEVVVEGFQSKISWASGVIACYNAAKYVQDAKSMKRKEANEKELHAIRRWVLHKIMAGGVTASDLMRLLPRAR